MNSAQLQKILVYIADLQDSVEELQGDLKKTKSKLSKNQTILKALWKRQRGTDLSSNDQTMAMVLDKFKSALPGASPMASPENILSAFAQKTIDASAQQRKSQRVSLTIKTKIEKKEEPPQEEQQDEYINQRIAKDFDGKIYYGTINEFWTEGTEPRWHVLYDDDDEEDFGRSSLMKSVLLYTKEKKKDPDANWSPDENEKDIVSTPTPVVKDEPKESFAVPSSQDPSSKDEAPTASSFPNISTADIENETSKLKQTSIDSISDETVNGIKSLSDATANGIESITSQTTSSITKLEELCKKIQGDFSRDLKDETKKGTTDLKAEVKKNTERLLFDAKRNTTKLHTEVKKGTESLKKEIKTTITDLRTEVKKNTVNLRATLSKAEKNISRAEAAAERLSKIANLPTEESKKKKKKTDIDKVFQSEFFKSLLHLPKEEEEAAPKSNWPFDDKPGKASPKTNKKKPNNDVNDFIQNLLNTDTSSAYTPSVSITKKSWPFD